MQARRLRLHLRWSLLFLGLFLSIHWQEVSSPTLNVDDWALVGDPIQQAFQSRPSWDLVYTLLFQNSFSPFFGWLIAGGSLYALAAVTTVFSPLITPAWVCLLALVVSLHAYVLDLFNFSFAIGLYLLPAALSVWGAVLMGYTTRRVSLSWLWGVLLVMFSMGIYQPTGYIGLGLIGLQGVSQALNLRPYSPQSWWRVLGGVLGGSLLYYVWARIAMAGQVENERTGFISLQGFLEKFPSTSVYREIYNTKVPLMSTAPQFILSISFLLILLLATVWLLRRTSAGTERNHRIGLLWISACFLTMLPLMLFYVLRAWFPSRALCLGNFGIASFSIIVLSTFQGTSTSALGQTERPFSLFISRFLVGVLIVAYVIPQAAFASKIWDLTQLLERRDMAMAQAILSDVRNEADRQGVPAEPFKLFGTTARTQLFPHWSSVGESAFQQSWSIVAIFRQLLLVKVEHIAYRSSGNEKEVRQSLPPCKAYPERGSIVTHQGSLLVCLEANPAAPGST
ncbi:MAG: hypothetical protein WBM08_10810 [Prochlorococcaceae cyanobacterium]